MVEDPVEEHGHGPGEEKDHAEADDQVPEHLSLARQAHAHIHEREADTVQGVEDDRA